TVLDNLWIGRVDAQQFISEEICTVAQDNTDNRNNHQTLQQNLVNTLELFCAHVLAGKAQRSLIDRVHSVVYKALDGAGGGVSCHYQRTKGVDRGLNQHVGDAEDSTLQTCRQTDSQHCGQHFAVELQMVQIQVARSFGFNQAEQYQNGRDCLRNNGRQCNTGNTHMEYDNEYQVKYNVDDTGQCQEIQRPLGISDRTQNCGTKVIHHEGRHSN